MQAMGHLGNDAIVKQVNGKYAIDFSLAHSEKYKNRDGQTVERTTWVNCTLWRDQATIAQWLKKGAKVWVEGTPSVHAYTKTSDNSVGASLDLRVVALEFAGGAVQQAPAPAPRPAEQPVYQQPAPSSYDADPIDIGADDLPF